MHRISEPTGLLGDAEQVNTGCLAEVQAVDLYDQVLLLNQALRGVISAGLCAPLHELNPKLLNGYMQSIQYLVDESFALTKEAFDLLLSAQSSK